MTASTQTAAHTAAISRRSLARYVLPAAALAVPGAAALLQREAEAATRRRTARNPRIHAGVSNNGYLYISGKGFAAGGQVDLDLRFNWDAVLGEFGGFTMAAAQTDERGAFYLEMRGCCPFNLDLVATQRRGVSVRQYFDNFLCGII